MEDQRQQDPSMWEDVKWAYAQPWFWHLAAFVLFWVGILGAMDLSTQVGPR